MKRVSPSFHSFDWRSNVRGVLATVKFATAAPDGVNRSSGSFVRLPMMVMTVSPAMWSLPSSGVREDQWALVVSSTDEQRPCPRSVSFRTDELGAQHGLVEVE